MSEHTPEYIEPDDGQDHDPTHRPAVDKHPEGTDEPDEDQ